jgi:hypothetical protein
LHPAPAFPPNASCVRAAPGAGGVTLDHDRLDLGGVDLTGLSREDVLAALTDAALEAFDELGPADFADGDPSGHWVTLEEGEHVFIHGGKVYATREAIEHLARGKPPPDTPAPHHPLRPVGKGRAPAPEKSPAPAPKAKPPAAKAAGAGGFDPHAEAQAIHDLVGRHVAAVHAGAEADEGGRGGGIGRKYPRMDAAHEAARREVEAHVADLVARAPTAIALRDVVRAYGLPAARGSKESLAQQLRDVLRQRMAASVRVYASADHEPDPSEAHFAAPLRPVRFTPYRPDAEFYSPDEPRDPAGRWAAGGAGGTKAERSAARVERKRAEKAADRQESGRAKNRNDALAAAHEEIAFTHGSMPKLMGADGYHLHQAVRAVHPNSLRGKPLREKAAAFRRLRDEATRAAAGLRRDPAAQPHLTGDRRANALNGLREIARRADRALGLIRREATSRRLPGVQSAQFGSADAEFYSPDQPRDDRGRWTTGGGEGAAPTPTAADRATLRQASLAAVRAYVRAGGEPTHVEHEQLAAHLARLTVDQLHAVKVEHGLQASGKVKSDLVARLAERFRLHRAKQEPAGRKALAEAVAGREGWHAPRDVMGGHAALHGPTGARVRADSGGTMFDVLTPGSELHSSHATAGEAVRAAEASDRFGTGGTTAEREHAARQEAMRKAGERAAARTPTTSPPAQDVGKRLDALLARGGELDRAEEAVRRSRDLFEQNTHVHKSSAGGFVITQHSYGAGKTHVVAGPFPTEEEADRRWLEMRDEHVAPYRKRLADLRAEMERLRAQEDAARFDDTDAPLRPVRFVPLAQPPLAAEFAPGGQEDACR